MSVETPHFAYPFSFKTQPDGSLAAAVTEQDSVDEVADCVVRITNTPLGSRDELPEFGVTVPLFEQTPVNVERLVSEIREWEPRAALSGSARIDSLDELLTNVRLDVAASDRGEE